MKKLFCFNTLQKQAAPLLLIAALFSQRGHADWVNSLSSGIPADAIVGGQTSAGTPVYMCRAYHYNDVQPGWTLKGDPACHFSYGGQELSSTNFDWWVPSWMPVTGPLAPSAPTADSIIPFWAEVNQTAANFRYVCRVGLTPGKYGLDLGGCLFPYGGVEHGQYGNGFEVLVDSTHDTIVRPGLKLIYNTGVFNGEMLGPFVVQYANAGVLPGNAIVGGMDTGGQPLYLCSAIVTDGWQPGKARQDWNACDVGYGGRENYESQYVTLVPNWVPEYNSNFTYYDCRYNLNCNGYASASTRPTPIGTDTNGSTLYFCQVSTPSGVYTGKITFGFSGCSYGLNGVENYSASYSILTDGLNLVS